MPTRPLDSHAWLTAAHAALFANDLLHLLHEYDPPLPAHIRRKTDKDQWIAKRRLITGTLLRAHGGSRDSVRAELQWSHHRDPTLLQLIHVIQTILDAQCTTYNAKWAIALFGEAPEISEGKIISSHGSPLSEDEDDD